MKKMIAIILAAVMLLGCLSACSSKGGKAPEGVDKDSKGYFASECGLDASITSSLEGLMQSVGYSSGQLVCDEAGNEDARASRRVSFRFLINLG